MAVIRGSAYSTAYINDRHENAGPFHTNRINVQTKLLTGKNAQLIIINHVNRTGCFTQECLQASNSTIRILANNPNPPTFAGSALLLKSY